MNDSKDNNQIPDAQPEFHQMVPLVSKPSAAKRVLARIKVRIVSFRVRLLDPDNLAGGVKDLLDGLRHSGLIPEDSVRTISLETEQEEVKHFVDERTEVTIDYPQGREPKPDELGRKLTF